MKCYIAAERVGRLRRLSAPATNTNSHKNKKLQPLNERLVCSHQSALEALRKQAERICRVADIRLVLFNPNTQIVSAASNLLRDRTFSRRSTRVLALVVQNHPQRFGAQFLWITCSVLRLYHDPVSILPGLRQIRGSSLEPSGARFFESRPSVGELLEVEALRTCGLQYQFLRFEQCFDRIF